MEIIDAELRLGPPGSGGGGDAGFGASSAAQKKRPSSTVAAATSEASGTDDHDAAPASKVQVVGWPPVGAYRKSTFQSSSAAAKESKGAGEAGSKQRSAGAGGGLYVKVSMDGAPYLRKVDLRTYGGYRELLAALDALFVGCFSSCSTPDNAPFAMAYEDKDGDLMLAGDVPWDMFISSCKRLRIMRSSEAR